LSYFNGLQHQKRRHITLQSSVQTGLECEATHCLNMTSIKVSTQVFL